MGRCVASFVLDSFAPGALDHGSDGGDIGLGELEEAEAVGLMEGEGSEGGLEGGVGWDWRSGGTAEVFLFGFFVGRRRVEIHCDCSECGVILGYN